MEQDLNINSFFPPGKFGNGESGGRKRAGRGRKRAGNERKRKKSALYHAIPVGGRQGGLTKNLCRLMGWRRHCPKSCCFPAGSDYWCLLFPG